MIVTTNHALAELAGRVGGPTAEPPARLTREVHVDARDELSRARGRLAQRHTSAVPATVIVGAQWGDEGKGKIVDLLAQHSDLVCRYQGGPNAGHTIVVGERDVQDPPDAERRSSAARPA